jgi:hypothetical protein
MQLGETIATYDVALALRGESGKFVVTSPAGEIYHITCEPDRSIVNLEWSGNGPHPQPFLIQKVAEPVPSSKPDKTAANAGETMEQPRAAKTPFLVDMDAGRPALPAAQEVAAPAAFAADASLAQVEDLDLLCREVGEDSGPPTVWVCLNRESANPPGTLVTNGCTTFNQFDAEIRRLHAQLDRIRYRARKKFYEAQIVAAGA